MENHPFRNLVILAAAFLAFAANALAEETFQVLAAPRTLRSDEITLLWDKVRQARRRNDQDSFYSQKPQA